MTQQVKNNHSLTLTRIIDAPRALVWQAWTDPAQLAQWWGPHGFTNPVCNIDVRPGGSIFIHMQAPDNIIYPMSGRYEEIAEPEKLVFTSAALDSGGNALFEVHNTILFAETAGKTTLTIHVHVSHIMPEAIPYLAGMEEGWAQSIDRLEVHVADF